MSIRFRGPTRLTAPDDPTADTLGVFVTTGTEAVLIHLAVPDNDGRYAFDIDRRTGHPHIADGRTSVVYEHLRNDRIAPVR